MTLIIIINGSLNSVIALFLFATTAGGNREGKELVEAAVAPLILYTRGS